MWTISPKLVIILKLTHKRMWSKENFATLRRFQKNIFNFASVFGERKLKVLALSENQTLATILNNNWYLDQYLCCFKPQYL